MKKFKIIRLFSLPLILFFILVLCAIHAHQGKNNKEIYTWEVQLPSLADAVGNSLNIFGKDYYTYSGDNDYITVKVVKDKARSDGSLYYWIRLFVHSNPEDIWTGFRDVHIDCDGSCVTDDGDYCGVPAPFNIFDPPLCISSFLNGSLHPHDGYEHFMMLFYVFEDLEDMDLGSTLQTHGRSWGSFYLWEFDCYDGINNTPDPYYHRIIGRMPSVNPESAGGCYFYVTRLDTDTWKFQYRNTNISIRESYCEKELATTGKKGKGRSYYAETLHDPLEGTVPNFAFAFTLKRKIS
jgi:hypothetical protein